MRKSKFLTSFQRCENQAHCVVKLVLEWNHSHVRMAKNLLASKLQITFQHNLMVLKFFYALRKVSFVERLKIFICLSDNLLIR